MMASDGHEPQTKLSQACFKGDLATLDHLLESGEDYLEVDDSGRKALHWAVVGQHLTVV
jgi:ankyrin repeat protein